MRLPFRKNRKSPLMQALDKRLSSLPEDVAWSVLTALRGPDIEGLDVKRATTDLIRSALLGRVRSSFCHVLALDGLDTPAKLHVREVLDREPACEHFVLHAKGAFRALGLAWDRVNTV